MLSERSTIKSENTVEVIREFNRMYLPAMDLLNSRYLDSSLSNAETRVLYELHERKYCTLSQIVSLLQLDKSYASRILHRFGKQGLLVAEPSETDRRVQLLRLTDKGRKTAEALIELTNRRIREQIQGLTNAQQIRLQQAMTDIMRIFGKEK
ncbi:MarR family winged helix-turn-helix transcriptional regulator [uncultured Faecalibaculum sp.]|uniref:MarR family winged helix-turn-helix transcriptional regulator n=1 Tax=uncultured Faecalibaculum sp. TaxID=1729681 RepID=UPI00260DA03C|nr:MarR family transcriptional regulator [uncultured Faecalibaculum sp.]